MSHLWGLRFHFHWVSRLYHHRQMRIVKCEGRVACNLKGSIIHIINLSLNATKRVGFLIKMGLEVFNCMSLQNTIKVYKDWLSSHHDTSQDIHPGQQNKHKPALKIYILIEESWVSQCFFTMKTPANLWDAVLKLTPKSIRQRKRVSQFEVLS